MVIQPCGFQVHSVLMQLCAHHPRGDAAREGVTDGPREQPGLRRVLAGPRCPATPPSPAARSPSLSTRQPGWFPVTLPGKESREGADAAVPPTVDTARLAGFLRAACQVRVKTCPARRQQCWPRVGFIAYVLT